MAIRTPKTGVKGKAPKAAIEPKKGPWLNNAPNSIVSRGGGGSKGTPVTPVLPRGHNPEKTPKMTKSKFGRGLKPPVGPSPKFRKSKYPAGNTKSGVK